MVARVPATQSNSEKGAATVARIVETAVPLVARRGGRGISLDHIAKAAGISKTGLMHHFKTKDALLNAVLDVRDEVDGFPQFLIGKSGVEALDHIVESIESWESRPETIGLFTVLLIENLPPESSLHDRLVDRASTTKRVYTRVISDAQASGEFLSDADPELVAQGIIAFQNGLETYWLLDRSVPVGDIAQRWRAGLLAELQWTGAPTAE